MFTTIALGPGKAFDFIYSFVHSSINISKIKKKDIIPCTGFTSMYETNYQENSVPSWNLYFAQEWGKMNENEYQI